MATVETLPNAYKRCGHSREFERIVRRYAGYNDAIAGLPPRVDDAAYVEGYTKGKAVRP